MREIKFRFFNGLGNDEMLIYSLLDLMQMKNSIQLLNNNTAMKYTGLKDKNGKEIYEGDIVESDWIIGVVDYDYEEAAYRPRDSEDDFIYNGWQSGEDWEVIGNIYENPELLERS